MKLSFWDILASMIMLAGLALATIFVNIFINPYTFINPFPPPTPVIALDLPTLTPSPRSLPELWTATPETPETTVLVTVTPTATPSQTGTVLILPTGTATSTRTASPSPSRTVTNTPNRTLTSVAYKSPTNTDVPDTSTSVVKTATQTPCTITGGYCDDANPRVNYVGAWTYYVGSGPYNSTLHFSRQVGATADYGFNGTKVSYFFTTYRNRGHARIYIDGVHAADISEYSSGSTSVWQQRWDSATLAAGYHNITVEVLDGYIDIDAFYVNWSGAAITNTPVVKLNTTTTINSDAPDPSVNGQDYTVTVTVSASSGTPTGTVSVSDGLGGTCSITLAGGIGNCDLHSTIIGAKTITASYGGDTNYNSSSTTTAHTVSKANSAVTITSDTPDPSVTGESYAVDVSVAAVAPGTGTPTGSVTVSDGTANCSITLAGGTGSCNLTSTTAGTKTITATYAGDTYFNGSSDTDSHTVDPADTTTTIVSDNPDPTVLSGDPYTVVVTVAVNAPGAGTPTGTVVIDDGNGLTCPITLSGGGGSCVLNSVTGNWTVTATYAGTANFNGSSDSDSHDVN